MILIMEKYGNTLPSIHVWMKGMASCITLVKLTYIIRGIAAEFKSTRKPLVVTLKHQSAF